MTPDEPGRAGERGRIWSVAAGWTDPQERLRACMALAVEERVRELRKAALAIEGGDIYDDYRPVADYLRKRADALSEPSSTYLYLECLDHTPPIRSECESGQHLSDLDQIRLDIADRESLVEHWRRLNYPDLGYFRNSTVRFLAAHDDCRIGIRDEYGHEHPRAVTSPLLASSPETQETGKDDE